MSDPRFYSAAGNRFVVLDNFEREIRDPSSLAIVLCARFGVDGLLIGERSSAGSDCRMLVYNKDGSRAEACGNGLRALARWAVETGHARESLVIETDSGRRRVTCLRRGPEIVGARTELGVPRLVEREATLTCAGRALQVTLVDVGNPHCIVFVPDVSRAEVAILGPALENHPRFPRRINVSFVEVADARLLIRTWERGVGETTACGTGVSASAVAAIVHGLVRSPVEIGTRGGRLQVDWDGEGTLSLSGSVEAFSITSS